ncbi:uncharacterized protein A1O5_05628 [Cladophialophora psammophila CBS 110553]|uniref:Glyoxalase/fosfomycin resistance/dioxygenase domain-containing protein n=1 Tax=Cladophialophora psammophila CBS 110553 TaxID=1182543 RepID=W9WV31_9EURO|nr:uncharacterized protein A1O5_05628 [Cladophialophora psammophila CBS 110553]EXJ71818.1 hypothetical protein A1O5_05628 [Cladophialophora psammophila CBS 110553]
MGADFDKSTTKVFSPSKLAHVVLRTNNFRNMVEFYRKFLGAEHIAFTFNTLSDLLLAYRQRKQQSISPLWPVNHGPKTSIYYRDPDGNMIETQVDNFENPDEATDFMKSNFFAENPIGTDFDPEDYITRLQNGDNEKKLLQRVEIGPRGVPEFAQGA